MGKYQFKATNLIAETFDSRGVQYHVLSHHNTDQLVTGCMLRSGSADDISRSPDWRC